MNQTHLSDVEIRPLKDSDKLDVCRIWVDGLQQSRKAAPWFLRSWLMRDVHRLRDAALSDSGDVGPDGKNLLQTYDGKSDRCMFVASTGEPSVVVGCCAVKKGGHETKFEPESKIGSIWRMSVDENYQRYGIATQLMVACEHWSREKRCTKIELWTINPIAANFYVRRMGYTKADHIHIIENWLAKQILPPVVKYTKNISKV